MPLFSYEIQRITGLAFDWLDQEWFDPGVLTELSQAYRDCKILEKKCWRQLEATAGATKDYRYKKRLRQLQNDLKSGRRLKLKKFLRFIAKEAFTDVQTVALLEELQSYQIAKKNVAKLEVQFQGEYEKVILKTGQQIQQISQEENFLKSLLLSSHSLYRRCSSFWQTTPARWNKKHRQTALSLLQYLTRMSTKTSPFSRFTAVGMRHLPSGTTVPATSQVHINTHLLAYLKQWLVQIPAFRQQHFLRLNPSIEKKSDHYRYLFNSHNLESVQRVAVNQLLEFLAERLGKTPRSYHEIMKLLQKEVAASPRDLESYLGELINIGILEWEWGISAMERNWSTSLLELVKGKKDFPEKAHFVEVMETLEDTALQLRDVGVEERYRLLRSAYERVLALLQFSGTGHSASEVEENPSDTFRSIKLRQLHFKTEQLFFEDFGGPPADNIPFTEFERLIGKLDVLVRTWCPPSSTELSIRLQQFFQDRYPSGYDGSLLDIYEQFYQYLAEQPNIFLFGQREAQAEGQSDWERAILKIAQHSVAGQIHLPWEAFMQVGKQDFSYPQPADQPGLAALLQTYRDETGWKAYVDSVFSGYGKLMGRFLSLFPEKVSRELQDWNDGLRGDRLWVENTDASHFNANVHPPLLSAEIRSPGAQQRLPTAQQISVVDLSVSYTPPVDLELLYQQQPVWVFDLGLESEESRSAMYRLLNCFAGKVPNWTWFVQRLNAIFRGEGDRIDGHVRLPRITIGEELVVQRQTWIFRSGHFPVPEKGESDAGFFLRIQRWAERNQLPTRGFVKTEGGDPSKRGSRSIHNKPQYIDLQHPHLVRLLGKIAKRGNQQISYAELLPSITAGINMGGKKLGVEKIVEWGGGPKSVTG